MVFIFLIIKNVLHKILSYLDTAYTERYLGLYEENRYTYEIVS